MTPDQRRDWRRRVFGHRELTAAHKVVLLCLETYADYRDGANARPGNDTLAASCLVDEKTIRRSLDAGARLGLIEMTAPANPKAHKAAVWRLISSGLQSPVDSVSSGLHSPVETDFHRTPESVLVDKIRRSSGHGSPPTYTDRSKTGGARCARHAHIIRDEDVPPCGACRDAGKAIATARREESRRRAEAAEAAERNCQLCDEGWVLGPDRTPIEPGVRCTHRRCSCGAPLIRDASLRRDRCLECQAVGAAS